MLSTEFCEANIGFVSVAAATVSSSVAAVVAAAAAAAVGVAASSVVIVGSCVDGDVADGLVGLDAAAPGDAGLSLLDAVVAEEDEVVV